MSPIEVSISMWSGAQIAAWMCGEKGWNARHRCGGIARGMAKTGDFRVVFERNRSARHRGHETVASKGERVGVRGLPLIHNEAVDERGTEDSWPGHLPLNMRFRTKVKIMADSAIGH